MCRISSKSITFQRLSKISHLLKGNHMHPYTKRMNASFTNTMAGLSLKWWIPKEKLATPPECWPSHSNALWRAGTTGSFQTSLHGYPERKSTQQLRCSATRIQRFASQEPNTPVTGDLNVECKSAAMNSLIYEPILCHRE